MKNLTDMKIVQIYPFKTDVLPFAYLNNKVFIDHVMKEFGFQSHTPLLVQQGVGPGFDFHGGILNDSGKVIPFEQFRLEPQRLGFVVMGESKDAKNAYERIIKIIKSISHSFAPDTEDVGEQTSCAVNLEVDFGSLFNPQFLSFLQEKGQEVASSRGNIALVEPRGFRASIKVAKKDNPETYTEHTLTIEPRIGTGLSERRYYTSSPVDSDTHLKLLKEFERKFKTSKS